jgi:uncharacterized protein with GYD domain
MVKYIALSDWTDQGVRNFNETVERYDAAVQALERLGGHFRDTYWTLGQHDIVSIIDAPDDETATAFLLKLASGGNIRTSTMRAFSREEVQGIIERAG